MFVNEQILEEYSVKTYEIDPYFYEQYRKKIQTDENGSKYILFRIDIYFTEYFLAIEIDEKGHTDRDLIFEEKIQKALEKKCKFIRINISKKIMMQTMKLVEYSHLSVSLKTKKIKSEIKALKDEIKSLQLQLTKQDV